MAKQVTGYQHWWDRLDRGLSRLAQRDFDLYFTHREKAENLIETAAPFQIMEVIQGIEDDLYRIVVNDVLMYISAREAFVLGSLLGGGSIRSSGTAYVLEISGSTFMFDSDVIINLTKTNLIKIREEGVRLRDKKYIFNDYLEEEFNL